jgi:hypothetical protein
MTTESADGTRDAKKRPLAPGPRSHPGQRVRPCRLEIATADELNGWITEQKRRWEYRLDALEAHFEQVQAEDSSE